jgi:hypothetical protein
MKTSEFTEKWNLGKLKLNPLGLVNEIEENEQFSDNNCYDK